MKVVHINTYDGNGGAGRAVLRLNKGLRLLGVDSEVLTLYQFNQNSGVTAISQSFLGKVRATINILAERFLIKAFLKDSTVPFSLQRFGLNLSHLQMLKNADVLHLHWINHGFLSPPELAELARLNKKIVWTLHDSNPLTGGCHVRYGCPGFEHQCGRCPVLKNLSDTDLSHRTWEAKKAAYQELDFQFIAPSTWMGDCTRQASLGRDKKVNVISNALETDIFKPLNKHQCRAEFGVDENAKVILAGYMPSTSDRHKGLRELQETLSYLADRPGIDHSKLELIFYGSDGTNLDYHIPIKHRFAGKITDDEILVKLYSLSDVFLFPSLEESMGYTALESLSCGTPVAAFNTSGVTDVVLHKKNGFLADLYDTRSLAEGIEWILNEGNKADLSAYGRKWAVDNFDLPVVAKKHLDLYNSLLEN